MKQLDNTEKLLAVLFDTGELPQDRAAQVLEDSGGIHYLGRLCTEEIAGISGLDHRTARRIRAALELGRQ
ncbi:hypothetical protein KKF84_03420, partial [Myxococcota bacterium]|nr:hypothetical protein [Myxococcota bacterium]